MRIFRVPVRLDSMPILWMSPTRALHSAAGLALPATFARGKLPLLLWTRSRSATTARSAPRRPVRAVSAHTGGPSSSLASERRCRRRVCRAPSTPPPSLLEALTWRTASAALASFAISRCLPQIAALVRRAFLVPHQPTGKNLSRANIWSAIQHPRC